MKVVVVDKFPESGLKKIQAAGCEVVYNPDAKGDALLELLKQASPDVLVVRSTKVTRPMLEASRLSLVVRAGSGYDTIDVAAATERGVYVSNCPGKNSTAVAELTFGLILALDRRIPDNVTQLRAGQWNKKEFSQARGLYGRTLGIIGVGQIGREVIQRAKAFGMPVVAWSRSLTPARASELGITRKASPEDVAAAADVVSVHLALTPETRQLLGEKFFQAMKRSAYFINTSRAEVVDYAALERAVQEKGIRVGLDVFPNEPAQTSGTFDSSLAKHGTVYGTHHIGASTEQAQDAIAEETARIIQTFKQTGEIPNVVNQPATPTAR